MWSREEAVELTLFHVSRLEQEQWLPQPKVLRPFDPRYPSWSTSSGLRITARLQNDDLAGRRSLKRIRVSNSHSRSCEAEDGAPEDTMIHRCLDAEAPM